MCRYAYLKGSKLFNNRHCSCCKNLRPNHIQSTFGTSFWHNLEPRSLPKDFLGPIQGRDIKTLKNIFPGVRSGYPFDTQIHKSLQKSASGSHHLWKSRRTEGKPTSSKSLKQCFRARGVAKMSKSRFSQHVST